MGVFEVSDSTQAARVGRRHFLSKIVERGAVFGVPAMGLGLFFKRPGRASTSPHDLPGEGSIFQPRDEPGKNAKQ